MDGQVADVELGMIYEVIQCVAVTELERSGWESGEGQGSGGPDSDGGHRHKIERGQVS